MDTLEEIPAIPLLWGSVWGPEPALNPLKTEAPLLLPG